MSGIVDTGPDALPPPPQEPGERDMVVDESSAEVKAIYTELRAGLACTLVDQDFRMRTSLQVKTVASNIWIFWRSLPSIVGAELYFVRDIVVVRVLSIYLPTVVAL